MKTKKSSLPKIIIDGYNLICALGIITGLNSKRTLPAGKLESARNRLLGLLIKLLPEAQRCNTTVIFDALEPPEHLPDSFTRKGIQVKFACGYDTADELLIEMILNEKKGTNWVIVTSDHRIQNAAARRHMTFYDSAEWYYDGVTDIPAGSDTQEEESKSENEEKPHDILPKDRDFWLDFFGEKE